MRRLVIALFALIPAAITAQPAVPYGMHGPTYSHMRHDANVWERSQTIFDAFHQLGMDYDRMDVWWSLLEPERGRYEWDYFDRAIQSYADNGIELMVILGYGPSWNDGAAPITDEDREAFGDYVYAMVNRYRHIVHEWEVWNEPNILPFWAPDPDVADYAALLRIAYARAKEADPDCLVLGGGMAGADFAFTEGIFEHGAGDSFDVLTYHNYGNRPTRAGAEDEASGLRAILEANGRGDVPIWLSEHGIFTGPGGVPERDQARDIVRLAIWRRAAGIERSVYLSLRDWYATDETSQGRDFWGVLDHAGQPKESFHAMRTMLAAMRHPYTGEVHLGEGIEAFLFGGPHDNAIVIWADEPTEITLDAGVTHLVTQTLLGEETLRTDASRRFTLALSDEPLWLRNVGDNLVLLAGIETDATVVARGDTADSHIRVRNALSRTVQCDFTPTAPAGLVVSPLPTLILAPGRVGEMPFNVTVGVMAPVGDHDVPITMSVSGPPLAIGDAIHHATMTVAEPFTATQIPAAQLSETGDLALDFRLPNHTGRAISVEAALTSDQVPAAHAVVEIGGDEATVSFPIGLTAITPGAPLEVAVAFTSQGHTATLDDSLRVFPIPRLAHEVVIDGDLAEWTGPPVLAPDQFHEEDFNPNLNGGAEDISATGWLAWTPEGLWMALAIHDDVIELPPDHMIWDWDGLQIAFDTRHDAREDTNYNYDDMEIEIGWLRDDSLMIFPGQYPPGRIEEVVEQESQVAVTVGENTINYEIHFPAGVLDPMALEAGALIGFNLIQNDHDGTGREGWLELAPGIGWGKEPGQFPTGVLMP